MESIDFSVKYSFSVKEVVIQFLILFVGINVVNPCSDVMMNLILYFWYYLF